MQTKWVRAVALAMAVGATLHCRVGFGEETKAQHAARMKWWRESMFGLCIHWGVYAVPAGTYKGRQIGGIGEWIMRRATIPVAEYRAFAKRLTPVKYDPDA